jgi:hypothetical protein
MSRSLVVGTNVLDECSTYDPHLRPDLNYVTFILFLIPILLHAVFPPPFAISLYHFLVYYISLISLQYFILSLLTSHTSHF